MAFFQRVRVEMQRRAALALLSEELQAWKASAAANVDGLGIHGSQLAALEITMDELQKGQDAALSQLSPALPPQQFAESYSDLLSKIVGMYDVWCIFRYIIAQRRDKRLRPLLDAADLVAADCYLTCLNRVRDWGLITEQQYREPPLVYLEAETSPATVSRGKEIKNLGFPMHRHRYLRLPIPIVTLPFDQAACVWLFCTLHHEVGHNLDQDLDLEPELTQHLMGRLEAKNVCADRQEIWQRWSAEILADAFGVLLGGGGFAHTLVSQLLMLAPLKPAPESGGEQKHPHPYVRIYLVSAMLRKCGVKALADMADQVVQTWEAYQRPDWVECYVTDSDVVAEVFLTQPLEALGKRPLCELVPNLASDADRTVDLARYLRTGAIRPPPTKPTVFPWRLVPVAAQLAFIALETPDADRLDLIQARALKYLAAIPRPKWLAAVDRGDFLRQLVRELDFRQELI